MTLAPRRVALVLIGIGTVVRLLLAPSYGYLGVDGDLLEHKQALHRILGRGFHEVYSANPRNDPALTGTEWDGGYFMNNLPGILYVRTPLAWLYRALDPAGFDLWDSRLDAFELDRTDLQRRLAATRGLTVLLKLPGIGADAALAWWVFFAVVRRGTPRQATAAAAAVALGPGIVFNTAFWGQHDSVWCGLVVAALALAHRGRVELAWCAAALACVTKPQALALAPLVFAEGWRQADAPRRLIRAAGAGAVTAALPFVPFLLHGTAATVVGWLARSTFGGEPFVSCNAANLWWLVSGGDGYSMRDDVPWLGPFTPRTLGLGAFVAVTTWALVRWRRRDGWEPELYLHGALVALAFFTVCTELHENHMMAVLPLVALSLPAGPRALGALLLVLSATFLANLALFDPAAMRPLAGLTGWEGLEGAAPRLASGVAVLTVGSFLVLAALMRRGRRLQEREPLPVSPAAIGAVKAGSHPDRP